MDVQPVGLLDDLEDHLLLDFVLLSLDGAGALRSWLRFLFHFRPTTHALCHFTGIWLRTPYLALKQTIAKATRFH